MATKKTELDVNDLLSNFEAGNAPNKANKDNKKAKQGGDWGEEEDDSYVFGIGKNQQPASKTKTTKKKTQGGGWGDLATEPKQAPKTADFDNIQDQQEKKKGIFKKPTGETKITSSVNVTEEYFPSLNEEPRPMPKKTVEPVTPPQNVPQQQSAGAGGVRKFVNAKKQGQGEHFVPLDPEVVEKAMPTPPEKPVGEKSAPEKPTPERPAPERPSPEKATPEKPTASDSGFRRVEGTFQRRSAEEPKEVPTDTKFKFGGEGPKKFVASNKISFKREEEKSEQERLREQKEREVEEKLLQEREELAKLRDGKKPTKENDKPEEAKEKQETQGQEEKRAPRFTNPKKEIEKPKPAEKSQPTSETNLDASEPAQDSKSAQAKEHIEMHGALTNKAWTDGPILKKAAPKK